MSNGSGSSRPTFQDEAVKRVKGTSTLFLTLLKNWKGETKGATVRASANNYYETLKDNLQGLFRQRWYRSPAEASWNNFVAVWNNGNCSWTEVYETFKPFNDGMQQSE